MKNTFQKIDIPSGCSKNTIKNTLMVKRPDGLFVQGLHPYLVRQQSDLLEFRIYIYSNSRMLFPG